jgi:hypothetical protein
MQGNTGDEHKYNSLCLHVFITLSAATLQSALRHPQPLQPCARLRSVCVAPPLPSFSLRCQWLSNTNTDISSHTYKHSPVSTRGPLSVASASPADDSTYQCGPILPTFCTTVAHYPKTKHRKNSFVLPPDSTHADCHKYQHQKGGNAALQSQQLICISVETPLISNRQN